MASARSVWGIDIGQCALKAIKLTFDAKQDRAVAVAFDFIEHPKILSQPDADPDELIKAALDKFVERNPINGSEVYISVPGQAGLSRFVKLPPVESKKVPDIVNFEARQQIPFALTDVVWDYQRIGTGDDEDGGPIELDVGIFAIRKEAVRKHLAPFQTEGIDVHTVQLAPVALYNFAAFDIVYHQAAAATEGEAPAEEEEGDTIVILDMGADKTDVVITDGDSIWLRNLPIGGNHFTRALAKDLKLTFAKAEHLKRNATKAPDPKKLYQAMRPVFQDFLGELQRSISFFASTHRSSVIKKIVGLGNGFRLPGLQKFLQQNLQYPVDRVAKYNALVGEEVLSDQTFIDNVMGFGVAYGLALQGLEQTPIQTNLLPQEIRTARLIRDKKPWSLVAAASLLLGFSGVFIGNYILLRAVNKETFNTPMQQAMGDASRYGGFKNSFDTAKTQYSAVNEKARRVIGSERIKERDLWLRGMKLLSQALPMRMEGEVREVANLNEVNIQAVRVTYSPGLADWFSKIEPEDQLTLADSDRQAPPDGAGWIFQIAGYTFNDGVKLYVQGSILKNLQSTELRNAGFSHAFIEQLTIKDDWTPSQAGTMLNFRDVAFKPGGGSGSSTPTFSLGSTSAGSSASRTSRTNPGQPVKEEFKGIPEDMRKYIDDSVARNRELGSSNKIRRTDFVIEFAWRPDFVPQPPPGAPIDPSTGAPAVEGATADAASLPESSPQGPPADGGTP